MGPDSSNLPSRPRFSWDLKTVPWTDGKGNQEDYASSVSLWTAFHNKLPDTNSNKIPDELRGIMLQSQLFGRARDLCKKIPDDTIQSSSGAEAIVKAVHKRDPLSAVSDVFQDFITLLSTKRGQNESFKNFESRFEAQVSKFNSHSHASKLPEALTAFMLLGNSAVDSSQRVSVLAAASPHETDVPDTATTADFLEAVSYNSVASVLRQCDNVKNMDKPDTRTALSSNAVTTGSNRNARNRGRRTLSPEQLADLKSRSTCRRCKMIGHWDCDHNPDGTLKPGVKSESPDHGSSSSYPRTTTAEKKSLKFNMVGFADSKVFPTDFVGPLLDDGAPYSGLGISELKILQPLLLPNWNGKLLPLPEEVAHRPFWQYGTGQHSSDSRRILGSVMLEAKSDQGRAVQIRHLVISGSSQWIIGRNVTKHCDIVHIGQNLLKLPSESDAKETISLLNQEFHSFIPLKAFFTSPGRPSRANNCKLFCATTQIPKSDTVRPWGELKKIVDKVHKHVCGHSSYSDIKVLLERNHLWNDEIQKYLLRSLESCTKCVLTSEPKPARKVSLSNLNRSFNTLVCIDHMHLEEHRVCHIMDSASRYSAGDVVPDTSMNSAIHVFESHWITPFWIPVNALFDPAFENAIFKEYLEKNSINGRPIPPRRHNKNVLESKHRVIRDIFLRLKADCLNYTMDRGPLLVQQALRISNDLYGNDVMSSHELAKGYTRPLLSKGFPVTVPDQILKAHEELIAKRKLTLILRSKSTTDSPIAVGDLVQLFIKQQHEKRGKWTSPKPVLRYEPTSCTVTVPGKNGRTVRAAVEDVRMAIAEEPLAVIIQEAIDTMDMHLENATDALLSNIEGDCTQIAEPDSSPVLDDSFDNDTTDNLCGLPSTGEAIEVYWPIDSTFYPGVVSSISDENGMFNISYDDGDEETLDLCNETWRRVASEEPLAANKTQLAFNELMSSEQDEIDAYFQAFGQKDFLLHHAQGLPTFPIKNAFDKEEELFTKNVRLVHVNDVPKNANIITSHVIYKVKINDDGSKKMKARIAPHGNKDKLRHTLKTDSATCPPTGIRLLLSLATIFKWPLAKIDFTSAFLQTGEAKRDVYVVPPRECPNRANYWLLLTAAYGLVNANAKWQEHSDEFLRSIGFLQLVYVPQLFYIKRGNDLQVAAVKIVDDILFTGSEEHVRSIIDHIRSKYQLGTVLYGPGTFLFFGLTICQDTDFSVTVHGDCKLNALEAFPIDRNRRKQIDTPLNDIELQAFRSVNSSIGWLGISASPFCSLYASYLQRKAPMPLVRDLVCQINSIRTLKKLGTTIRFKRPPGQDEYKISVLIFSDASRPCDYGQLGYVAGLLIGEFGSGSVFHTLSWTSHKSKRPVKSIGAAEILAAGEAIDEGKMLVKAYETLLNIQVDHLVAVDSKDLFTTLSTCRNATDRSIRADVNVIRYEFETSNVSRMLWIPGKTNLSDPLTKPNSPLTQALQLMMFSGELSMDFPDALSRSSDQCTG